MNGPHFLRHLHKKEGEEGNGEVASLATFSTSFIGEYYSLPFLHIFLDYCMPYFQANNVNNERKRSFSCILGTNYNFNCMLVYSRLMICIQRSFSSLNACQMRDLTLYSIH